MICYNQIKQKERGADACATKYIRSMKYAPSPRPSAKDYGVDALYLFGSYARGDATPESDMDFRIDKGSVCSVFKLGGYIMRWSTASIKRWTL